MVRWTGIGGICGGRLRVMGEVYDDFNPETEAALIDRGVAEALAVSAPEPIATSKRATTSAPEKE